MYQGKLLQAILKWRKGTWMVIIPSLITEIVAVNISLRKNPNEWLLEILNLESQCRRLT